MGSLLRPSRFLPRKSGQGAVETGVGFVTAAPEDGAAGGEGSIEAADEVADSPDEAAGS